MQDLKPTLPIFILKSNTSSILNVDKYLISQGWEVISMTEVKEALLELFSRPIFCAMVTVDHPNAKVLQMPAILQRNLNLETILFAEGKTQLGINYIKNLNHPYSLLPPISAPAVARLIEKISKEHTPLQNAANSNLEIKGGRRLDELIKLFEGEGLSHMKSATQEKIGDDCRNQNVFAENNVEKPSPQPSDADKDAPLIFSASSKTSKVIKTGSDFESHPAEMDARNKKIEPNIIDLSKHGDESKVEHDSILIRGAEHALSKISLSGNTSVQKTETLSSRVSCFKIKSDVFSGVAIMAFTSDYEDQIDVSLRESLVNYMVENGVNLSTDNLLDLRLNEISFEKWSMNEATLLRKSLHGEGQIAFSFFPYQETESPLEISSDQKMYKMDLLEIRPDSTLEFDLYLHFPVNGKYVRYAEKDQTLPAVQHSRLLSKGMSQIHIRKDSEKDICRYRVQNFLNDKINEFLMQSKSSSL